MEQFDTAAVYATKTRLEPGDSITVEVEIAYDLAANAFNVRATDTTTKNDASRIVRASVGVRSISAQEAINKLPDIIEEIIVINKLLGSKT